MKKSKLSDNDIVALTHRNAAYGYRLIADYIEKHKLDYEDAAQLLRDMADEVAAQAVVVELRDML
jgi:hypothetical protein